MLMGRWLLGRIDRLLGSICALVLGLGAAQAQGFALAYLQRIGGHLDEATRLLGQIRAGVAPYDQVAPVARAALEAAAAARAQTLAAARDAIAAADPFLRPLEALRHADPEIARATWTDYVVSLPVEPASLAYGLTGMVLAWLVYDGLTALLRWPFRRHIRYG